MNVLIVESAAKARTLKKYLGDGWEVVATGGHVETLPSRKAEHGKDAGKAYWANRPGELPTPPWVWTDRGQAAVEAIVEAGGGDATFWIATDPDREGEFIAWCLERLLSPHGPTHRVTFQEVTKEAVTEALRAPRRVDQRMVDSALVRKFVDRIVGFRTSKIAGAVVAKGASMGRVQTPTLGFVVDKELEREAFVPTPYFEVRARALGQDLQVRFHQKGDPDPWRDEAGKANSARTFHGDLAQRVHDALAAAGEVTLTGVTARVTRPRAAQPPFSTDALLQDAGARFGWSPKKTSALASMLYEAGHVTYIRTDSTRLAQQAILAARKVVEETYGQEYLGSSAPSDSPAAGAAPPAGAPIQDAHEAIRPTRLEVADPGVDDEDAARLYRLIRARTLASQMAPATGESRSIEAACRGTDRPLTGSISWRTFPGWEAAYTEFEEPRPTAPPDIPLREGAVWPLDPPADDAPNPLLIEDETQPPGRYRAHTLVKAMKDAGIGRPSTYARTIEKLEEREFVESRDGALAPTVKGRAIWLDAAPLYAMGEDGEDGDEGAELFSTGFTAEMEEGLDRVATGQEPAAARWESWRELVRALHEAARERKDSGASTLKQHDQLRRFLANAPESFGQRVPGGEPEALSYREAAELLREMREAGVDPAPTEKQMAYLQRLLDDLELPEEERSEILGVEDVEGIHTAGHASRAIDELQRLFDERRPPSAKQRRFIDGLLKETEVSPEEAAALVGVASLDDLTGGREGTASALIELLEARKAARDAEGSEGKGGS